jgi:hypothetical protein
VAAGALESKGVEALILPMTIALGRGDKKGGLAVHPALQRFRGVVYYTHEATRDEFLQPRPLPDGLARKARKMPSTAEDLWKELTPSVVSQPVAVDMEGKKIPGVVVSSHVFPGSADAEILAVLRRPVGQKEEVGADGVAHMVPDPKGGRPVERASVDVTRFGSRRFFDLRRRQEIVAKDKHVLLDLPAGECIPIAVLPYGPLDLKATAVRAGDRLTLAASGSAKLPHVIRVDVLDKAGGEADLLLSRNLLLDASGRVETELRLAVEERARTFEVRFTDILTGSSVRVSP